MEIIGVKYRELFSVVYQIPFNIGHLTLPLFAYFIRDWQDLQFALSIPSIVLLSYFWLIPESPRWLFTMGRVSEAATILEKAAHANGKPTDNIRIDLEKVKKITILQFKAILMEFKIYSHRYKIRKLKLAQEGTSSIFFALKICASKQFA